MARYRIAVLPGDGIGIRSNRSRDDGVRKAANRCRFPMGRCRLGILV